MLTEKENSIHLLNNKKNGVRFTYGEMDEYAVNTIAESIYSFKDE